MPPRSSRPSLASPPAKAARLAPAAKAAEPQPAAAPAAAKRGAASRAGTSAPPRATQIAAAEPDEPPAPATQPAEAAAKATAPPRKSKAKTAAPAEQASPAEATPDTGRPQRARVPPKPLPITAPLTAAERAEARAGNDVKARSYEARWWAKGSTRVAGVDEAGRGPLAGPVVAAACIVPSGVHIAGVADSKQLSEEQREALYEELTKHPQIEWSACIIEHTVIDEINILQATMRAMEGAVAGLKRGAPDRVLVDGNRVPPALAHNGEAIIGGDDKSFVIGAASIIAKVTRDRIMLTLDKRFPLYGFAQHKGYGTKAHMEAIARHGPCDVHRRTFAPIKHMV